MIGGMRGMIRMLASSHPARATSCADRYGAPAEASSAPFIRGGKIIRRVSAPTCGLHEVARAGREEIIIRTIAYIPPIIPLAFQPWFVIVFETVVTQGVCSDL